MVESSILDGSCRATRDGIRERLCAKHLAIPSRYGAQKRRDVDASSMATSPRAEHSILLALRTFLIFPISKHASELHLTILVPFLITFWSLCRKCLSLLQLACITKSTLCTASEIMSTTEEYGLSQAAPKRNPNTLVILQWST